MNNQLISMTNVVEKVETIVSNGLAAESASNSKWDTFVAGSPYGHLMQTSSWGALKAHFGWDVERVVLADGDAIIAGALILYRSLPLNLGRLAYIPMGPVVDWEKEDQVNALLAALQRAVRRRAAFCLKIEPTLLNTPVWAAKLGGLGFHPGVQTVQWRSTILIDLDCTEDEMLARFNKKHRQKLHKAIRDGIVIKTGTADDLPFFSKLMSQTAERKEFAVYPPDYYRTTYEMLAARGKGSLLLATYENTILAGIMVFVLGTKAYCMYAASSNEDRDMMPTYLLHWEGIRWARSQGCVAYDFCGIPDEVGQDPDGYAHEERHDSLWGVYRFKRGFGGQVVCYTSTYDYIYSRALYFLYNKAIAFLHNKLGEAWNRRLFSG